MGSRVNVDAYLVIVVSEKANRSASDGTGVEGSNLAVFIVVERQ